MLIRTVLSLDPRSYSFSHTPTSSALNLPFYLTGAGHFFAKPDYYTERRDLDEYIVFLTLDGEGVITVGEETYPLTKGQLFFLHCMDHHDYHTLGGTVWEFCYIQFSGPCVKHYYDLFHEHTRRPLEAVNREYMTQHFEDILKILGGSGKSPNLKISNCISNLLTELILEKSFISDQTRYERYKKDIVHAMEYLQKNFHRNLRIEEISDLLHISKYYFIKIFKNYAGIAPYEYLLNFRINRSKDLLKATTLPVNEIAEKVGFSDPSAFIRSFKKAVGVTPLKYRDL